MKVRFAVAPGGELARGGDVTAFADALEASEFDGIWLSDVPVGPLLDPLLGLALIAGRSSRLRLGANVVPLGRNPFLLAKELAQLDRLSGGRLLLSFVPGLDQPGEREALLMGTENRGALLEEVLGLVRAWWAGQEVEHHSPRWSFSALAPAARPVQNPLEVWLGGRGPKALARVGRVADGWLGAMVTPEEARTARERIQESAGTVGREIDPEHFGLSIPYARSAPDAALLSGFSARRRDLDPLALRSLLGGYIDAGLSKFVLRPVASVESWEEEAHWLAEAVIDLQS